MPAAARLSLLLACFLWAISFVATKVALETVPPLTVVTLRLVMSALCFAAWAAVAGGLGVGRGWWPRLLLLSLIGAALHYGTQTVGLQYTSASNASLYAITAPITIALLGALLLKERLGLRTIVGISVAVAGVLVVMGPQTLLALSLPTRLLGDLLVLASIVMWGLFTVLGKRATDELGALSVTAAVTVMGALWMVPVGLAEIHARSFSLAMISPRAWLAIGFLGVTCSFLATLLYFAALARTDSRKVGVYLYTIPPMTAAIAALSLGESLTLGFLAGSVLVFAGVALTESG
jgi:drug/metabolite transporter (DMT)-like permease